jgi:hypothetical protein
MPLTTTEAELDEGIDIIEQALIHVYRGTVRRIGTSRSREMVNAIIAPTPRLAAVARRTNGSAQKSTTITGTRPGVGKKQRRQNGHVPA